MPHWHLPTILGEPVADPDEEAFLVFAHSLPSHSLGFVDSKASVLDISVAGRDLAIHQSQGLLTSNRERGTTGAVVWKVTPHFAEWIASPSNFLFHEGILSSDSVALELGTGVSGIVALTLAERIRRYVATDQDYVLKLLSQNISENWRVSSGSGSTSASAPPPHHHHSSSSKRKQSSKSSKSKLPRDAKPELSSNIETLALDWEVDSLQTLAALVDPGTGKRVVENLDVVIACDCIYNEALIDPFVSCCAEICGLRSKEEDGKPTLCIVAQQLRSPEVFELWLRRFHRSFEVFRVPDHLLTESLKDGSGYVVHIGLLR